MIPLDWSRRHGGFGSAQDGVRAADRQLEGENPRVGWAEHQASADQKGNLFGFSLTSPLYWRRVSAACVYASLLQPVGPDRTRWTQTHDGI